MVGEINRTLKSKIVEHYGSQRNFATEVNIPEVIVSRVVRGRFNLANDEKTQWAEALNTTPEQLFNDEN